MTNEQGHIFISYKSQEFAYAAKIRDQLQAWSYATWLDKDKLKAGRDWQKDIDSGLRSSAAVVGIVTPAALNSHMVRAEWSLAFAKGIPFIPLRFADCELTYPYNSLQYIDFIHDEEAATAQLKAALTHAKPQTPEDPYYPYLDKFYDYITELFKVKIITREVNERPEPISLDMELSEGMVSVAPERIEEDNDMFATLFAVEGIASNSPELQPEYHGFQSVFEQYEGRVLVLGEPGAGKTITLLNAARDAVVRRMQDFRQPLPLFGLISTWDSVAQPSLADWLAGWGRSLLKADDLRQMIANGDTLLLLDGLDELGRDRKDPKTEEHFDPRKRFMAQIPTNNAVIVTCREKDYQEIGEKITLNQAVTLKPLSDAQMQTYLARQPELQAALQVDPNLKEMLTTPLLLSFFAFAFQDMTAEERQQLKDLSKSPGDLRDSIFETYVKKRYEHEERKLRTLRPPEAMLFTLEEMCNVLGHIAMRIASTFDIVDRALNSEDFGGALEAERRQPFTELASRLQILIPLESGSLWFRHLLLRDYFAFGQAIKAITASDSIVRLSAVHALGNVRDVRAFDLLAVAVRDTDNYVRSFAANALGKLRDPRAFDLLLVCLRNSDRFFRSYSARGLGWLGDPRALIPLIRVLKDSEVIVRMNAARSLGMIGNARSVEPLIVSLYNDYDHQVRAIAAEALESIGTPEALAAVEEWRKRQDQS